MMPAIAWYKMSTYELDDIIESMVAFRQLFDNTAAFASWTAPPRNETHRWADSYIDAIQAELRDACAEYLRREITDEDERLTRGITVASAYSWLADPPFDIRIEIVAREVRK